MIFTKEHRILTFILFFIWFSLIIFSWYIFSFNGSLNNVLCQEKKNVWVHYFIIERSWFNNRLLSLMIVQINGGLRYFFDSKEILKVY